MKNARKKWTAKEIEYLEFSYSSTSLKEMARVLGRSEIAVKSKASNLKVTKDWSEYEIDYLKAYYETAKMDELIFNLDRSKEAIIIKANRLGLTRRGKWSKYAQKRKEQQLAMEV